MAILDAVTDWLDEWWPVLLMAALLVGGLWFVVLVDAEDRAAWETFKQAHDCRLVESVPSSTSLGTGVGVGANGSIGVVTTTQFEPGREAWLCNDGVKYWR